MSHHLHRTLQQHQTNRHLLIQHLLWCRCRCLPHHRRNHRHRILRHHHRHRILRHHHRHRILGHHHHRRIPLRHRRSRIPLVGVITF